MEKVALKIKNYFLKIIFWAQRNPLEFWILVAILVVASVGRLYHIDRYMTFLGDEGRDVIVVRRLLTQGHPPLIGPGTSIGNMYLGPIYYYMMAPALLFANFSPIGPAIQIAILGIFTVWFVWYLGRLWFGKTAALIASALYAISPVVIVYSRSSWNPNIMPFFALLSIFSIWKIWRDKKFIWFLILGISYAFVLQSHYLGLLLSPTLFLFWLLTFLEIKKKDRERKIFWRFSLFGFLILVVLMSPLFFFDMRHNWINFKALYTFFTIRQETVSIRPWTALPKVPEVLNLVNITLLTPAAKLPSQLATAAVLLAATFIVYISFVKKQFKKVNPAYWLLISWLGFSLIGFGIYKQNIYAHYFGFIFAVPFFVVGIVLSKLLKRGILLKIITAAALAYLIFVNLANSPLRKEPNSLLQRSQDVSRKIISEAGGNPMNLAVIADNNYEAGYQYFVDLYGGKVLEIDSQNPSTFANQLFVVCELIPTSKCDPTHNPKSQIANFGWSKIENQWELDGVIIYKLVHSL